jgi:hypothetical protein
MTHLVDRVGGVQIGINPCASFGGFFEPSASRQSAQAVPIGFQRQEFLCFLT